MGKTYRNEPRNPDRVTEKNKKKTKAKNRRERKKLNKVYKR